MSEISSNLASYYFEARVRYLDAAEDEPHVVIRGWYQNPGRTRWEFTCGGHPSCDEHVRVLLIVGDEFLAYEPSGNTYVRSGNDLPDNFEGPFPVLGLTNFQPGPLLPEVADYIRDEFPFVGREELLGITVANYGNAWWIDEKHSFALKQASADASGSTFVVEVTKVEYNLELDLHVFEFEPPQGSREVPASSGGTFSTAEAPPGFLFPTFLPEGYEGSTGFQALGNSLYELTYDSDLTITQEFRAGGPIAAPEGTPVSVRGTQGFQSRDGSGKVLSWVEGELKITISSSRLPFEEIHRVAEGMR